MIQIQNYIAGELVDPVGGGFLDNVEPATGQVYSQIPDSDEADVDRAVAAAGKAFDEWSHTPAQERSRIMLRIADLLEQNLDDLARAETIDNGKPITVSRNVDIPRAIANLRFFGTAILHSKSEMHLTEGGVMATRAINYTLRQPIGVVGTISPWNLPLYLFTWKFAPALAVGNTVVAKPSEVTPMTAFRFSELCIEAGLPPGVLNVVHGTGPKAGAAIVEHPDVKAISFTGGTRTGEWIASAAVPKFKKLSLEMGGKNPNIIFADADYEQALATSVQSSFANQGQICLCGSRILIERPRYERFVEDLAARASELRIGDPLDESTQQGAVVSKPHLEKIRSCIDLAKQEGGTIVCGGASPDAATLPERCRGGFFMQPTVITGLDAHCRTNQEEIFGPVVTVIPFDTEREAIEWANCTPYGLSASVWTGSVDRAHRVAERIEAGTVWINCWLLRDLRVPFGGVKQSGVGREGGEEALRFFTEAKNVCVRMSSETTDEHR